MGAWWGTVVVWWNGDGWRWVSEWVKSPGFAGFAAVLAATLAFAGARHQARLNAWWQRIEWALNLYTRAESSERERLTGLAAIGALQRSRLARKGEQELVRQIVDANTLDLFGDGVQDDDVRVVDEREGDGVDHGYTHTDASYSRHDVEEETDDED